MDYKYIEQLLERYFAAETTLQEEQILRAFFAQADDAVPAHLRSWKPLFALDGDEELLGSDFDERVLALTEDKPVVKARTISMSERMRPLLRAAAIVAVVLTLSNAMNLRLGNEPQTAAEVSYAEYKDTYDDPAMAYDQIEDALQLISDGYRRSLRADSMRIDSLNNLR